MLQTQYTRADGIEAALAAHRGGSDAKYLSGGQTLLPTMKQRLAAPDALVDLGRIDALKGIEVSGDHARIGAGTTHAEVHGHEGLKRAIPALSALAGLIGDPAVRHMGTLGGSIANNDPAADYPAACLALDATIETDRRELSAAEFFTGMFETALEDDEIVTAVRFRVPDRAAYEKFRNPASRYAMAGAFVASMGGEARVAVSGAGSDGVFRWSEAEGALGSNLDASALASMLPDEGDMLGDLHASAAYRAHLVKVMAMRAAARAGGDGGAEDHTQGQIGSVPAGTAGAVRAGGDAGAASESGSTSTDASSSASEHARHVRDHDTDGAPAASVPPGAGGTGGEGGSERFTTSTTITSSGGASASGGVSVDTGGTTGGSNASSGASSGSSPARDTVASGSAAQSEHARHVRDHESGGAPAASIGTDDGGETGARGGSAGALGAASSASSGTSSGGSAASETGSPTASASATASERTRHVRDHDSGGSSGNPGARGTAEAPRGLVARILGALGLGR